MPTVAPPPAAGPSQTSAYNSLYKSVQAHYGTSPIPQSVQDLLTHASHQTEGSSTFSSDQAAINPLMELNPPGTSNPSPLESINLLMLMMSNPQVALSIVNNLSSNEQTKLIKELSEAQKNMISQTLSLAQAQLSEAVSAADDQETGAFVAAGGSLAAGIGGAAMAGYGAHKQNAAEEDAKLQKSASTTGKAGETATDAPPPGAGAAGASPVAVAAGASPVAAGDPSGTSSSGTPPTVSGTATAAKGSSTSTPTTGSGATTPKSKLAILTSNREMFNQIIETMKQVVTQPTNMVKAADDASATKANASKELMGAFASQMSKEQDQMTSALSGVLKTIDALNQTGKEAAQTNADVAAKTMGPG